MFNRLPRRSTACSCSRFPSKLIRAHVLDCGQHGLLNRQSRPPAQSADPRAVEQNKGAVANPAAFTSRIRKLGMQAEMLTNPADGVVHLAILVGSKIEDVHFGLRALDSGKNRVDAILHVQIRLPLMPIAQHMKMLRVLGKLLVEIEHVPVRVALSQDRYEAKNVALQSEAFAISLNQAFRSQLRGSIKRGLDGKGTCLRSGKNFRLSVDRSCRRKNKSLAALLAHGFEHIPGCDRVLIQILAGMFGAEAYVGIGGEMNHKFRALHRLSQTLPVEQVSLVETKLRMSPRAFQKPRLSSRHVIEPYDAVACREQAVDHVTAYKAGCSGN